MMARFVELGTQNYEPKVFFVHLKRGPTDGPAGPKESFHHSLKVSRSRDSYYELSYPVLHKSTTTSVTLWEN